MAKRSILIGLSVLLPVLLISCQKAGIGNHNTGDGVPIKPFVTSAGTKGTIITTDGINQPGKSFKVHAYLDASIASATGSKVDTDDKTNFHFIGGGYIDGISAGEQIDYTGDGSNHSWDWHAATLISGTETEKDAGRPMWRSGLPIRFWSYYPADYLDGLGITWPHKGTGSDNNTPTNTQQTAVSFSYALPAPATAAPYQDAENQKDLLFAYNDEKRFSKRVDPDDEDSDITIDTSNPGNTGSRTDEYIDIHFYHVLAAVNFDITVTGEVGTVNISPETTITLNHVRYSGDCTISGPALAAPVAGTSGAGTGGVTWSNLSTDFKSFSQSFSTTDDFEILGTSPYQYVRQKTSGSKTFFMIPQTLSDATLSVGFEFKDGGVPFILEEELDADEWKAGKIYTYRITATDTRNGEYTLLDVSLDVKDWVDGSMDTSF